MDRVWHQCRYYGGNYMGLVAAMIERRIREHPGDVKHFLPPECEASCCNISLEECSIDDVLAVVAVLFAAADVFQAQCAFVTPERYGKLTSSQKRRLFAPYKSRTVVTIALNPETVLVFDVGQWVAIMALIGCSHLQTVAAKHPALLRILPVFGLKLPKIQHTIEEVKSLYLA